MYEELVKRLRDAAKMSEALAVLLNHSEGTATVKLYNEAADSIEELNKVVYLLESDRDAERDLRLYAEERIPLWIPVKEPPKEGEPVFVHIPCRYRKQESIPMIAFWEQGQWKEYESHRLVYNITHWMPLPTPPKEDA